MRCIIVTPTVYERVTMKPRLSTILWWNFSSQCAVVGGRTGSETGPGLGNTPSFQSLELSGSPLPL